MGQDIEETPFSPIAKFETCTDQFPSGKSDTVSTDFLPDFSNYVHVETSEMFRHARIVNCFDDDMRRLAAITAGFQSMTSLGLLPEEN